MVSGHGPGGGVGGAADTDAAFASPSCLAAPDRHDHDHQHYNQKSSAPDHKIQDRDLLSRQHIGYFILAYIPDQLINRYRISGLIVQHKGIHSYYFSFGIDQRSSGVTLADLDIQKIAVSSADPDLLRNPARVMEISVVSNLTNPMP